MQWAKLKFIIMALCRVCRDKTSNMERKERLINSLRTVITALENDSVKYDWNNVTTCNCGLISQTLLGISQDELSERIDKEFNYDDDGNEIRTWKDSVHAYCPIAKKPLKQIFIDLENAGLTKDDICHLEYMENEAILKKSGIKNFWSNIFGLKKDYYQKRENLIKYLKAWLSILNETAFDIAKEATGKKLSNRGYSKNELNKRLLIAVAEEDYINAAKLRDAINEYA